MFRSCLQVCVGLSVMLAAACAGERRGLVLTPAGPLEPITWTDAELVRDIAIRPLRTTDQASYAVVRIVTAEAPHVHDRHDLTVFVLSGRVAMHLADRMVIVEPGNLIDVPRGMRHWAENLADPASEAYVIFTPAFDGRDRRLIQPDSADE